ncbi:MAG: hypothetical protein KDD55_09810 [Bdellovibrionales bacterium]|nr:hypothetical protein [Bdellovibrionales bacterium]
MNIDGAAHLAASQAVTQAEPTEKVAEESKESPKAEAAEQDAVKVAISADAKALHAASSEQE